MKMSDNYIRHFKEEYDGKEVWHCEAMKNRLNLNPKTASLCHGFEVGDQHICNIENLNADTYYRFLSKKFKENQNENAVCRSCSRCKWEKYHFKPLEYITLTTNLNCNSHCIYCCNHFGVAEDAYNPLPYIKEFEDQGCISQDCLFDWGGGEPTQNPYQAEGISYLSEKGYYELFNTNAIEFSEEMYQALKRGKGKCRVSVDSGTKKTYYEVKGQDKHTEIWNNITKYASATSAIELKYNVFNLNSDCFEADEFLRLCKEVGNPKILIEAEFSCYCPAQNAGPFYFTEKEMGFAKYLFRRAKEEGFAVGFCKGSFGSRNPQGSDGQYLFTEQYKDNIDRTIITNGIYLSTAATAKHLAEKIKSNPVIIWGNGKFGRRIVENMIQFGIEPVCYADSHTVQEGRSIDGISVFQIEEALNRFPTADVILGSVYFKDMLKMLNDMNYQQLKGHVYYMPGKKFPEVIK